MGMNLDRFRQVLVVTVLIATVIVTLPSAAAAKGEPSPVKLCQRGGWQTLATAETPWIPFASQRDCISYANQGITPISVWPTSLPPSASVELANIGFGLCGVYAEFSNLVIGQYYKFVLWKGDGTIFHEHGGSDFSTTHAHEFDHRNALDPGETLYGAVYLSDDLSYPVAVSPVVTCT